MRRHCDEACAQYREGGYRSGDDRARGTGTKAHRADGAASNECMNPQVDKLTEKRMPHGKVREIAYCHRRLKCAIFS